MKLRNGCKPGSLELCREDMWVLLCGDCYETESESTFKTDLLRVFGILDNPSSDLFYRRVRAQNPDATPLEIYMDINEALQNFNALVLAA